MSTYVSDGELDGAALHVDVAYDVWGRDVRLNVWEPTDGIELGAYAETHLSPEDARAVGYALLRASDAARAARDGGAS